RRRYQAAKAAEARARQAEFARYAPYIQIVAGLILLFALSLVGDYLMRQHTRIEPVLARQSRPNRGAFASIQVRTPSFQLSLPYKRARLIGQGDYIRLSYTPLYGVRTRVSVWKQNPEGPRLSPAELEQLPPQLRIYPKSGIFNVFSFALILLLISAGTALSLRRWPELQFKFGLLALLLLPINLFFLLIS
ncbi:MAG: hypothetical protein D6722_02950, partial [Bacteroidetes bacterium]